MSLQVKVKNSKKNKNAEKSPTSIGTCTDSSNGINELLSSIENSDRYVCPQNTFVANNFLEETSCHYYINQQQRNNSSRSNSDFGFFPFDLDIDESDNKTTMRLPDAIICENDLMNESKPWSECSNGPVLKKFARSLSVPEDCIISGVPSVTDLDRIQREKRETAEKKDAFESESHINGALRTVRSLLEDDLTMDSGNSLNNNRCAPRLRIRPQPVQTMLIHGIHNDNHKPTTISSPIVIPKDNMLYSNQGDYANSFPHLFPSPNSDRFVLHFPEESKESTLILDQLEDAWPSSNNALMVDSVLDRDEDDNSPLTSSAHHEQASRDETGSTSSRSRSSTGSPSKRNLPSTKPEVIRKQPIRLKPKIPSKQQDLTRMKSASSLSSSSSEDLDLPVRIKNDNTVKSVQPAPVRIGFDVMDGDDASSENYSKKATSFPLSPAAHTALRSNEPYTHFQMCFDTSEDLAVPNFESSDVSSSSARTNNKNEPISALNTNLLEQRFSSDVHITKRELPIDPYPITNYNIYASPQDTTDLDHMSSPPQMEPKKIENQILKAREAALRFSSQNNQRSVNNFCMSSLDPVTPPILQDCNYTTPQSRLEKPDFYNNNLGEKEEKASRKSLFLPRLSSFSGKSEGTFDMDIDIDNLDPGLSFIYNDLSGTKISES